MIKKGQNTGYYKGVEYTVKKVDGHKDRWHYIVNGKDSLPKYFSRKEIALDIAHDAIDASIVNGNTSLSWEQMQSEMSIAGEPEIIVKTAMQISDLIKSQIDIRNIPSLENMIWAIEKINIEITNLLKNENNKQHGQLNQPIRSTWQHFETTKM